MLRSEPDLCAGPCRSQPGNEACAAHYRGARRCAQHRDHRTRHATRRTGDRRGSSHVGLLGMGTEHAAQLLITAGGDPERLRSRAHHGSHRRGRTCATSHRHAAGLRDALNRVDNRLVAVEPERDARQSPRPSSSGRRGPDMGRWWRGRKSCGSPTSAPSHALRATTSSSVKAGRGRRPVRTAGSAQQAHPARSSRGRSQGLPAQPDRRNAGAGDRGVAGLLRRGNDVCHLLLPAGGHRPEWRRAVPARGHPRSHLTDQERSTWASRAGSALPPETTATVRPVAASGRDR